MEDSAMDDAVYEIVLFELRPEVARSQYLQASTRATTWLRTQPGFLSREILEDESGQWIELLRWATLDDALAAARAIEETEHVAAIMDTVVPDSIRMLHPKRLAAFPPR
jgi:antibiotic biosynthesis monooxygenase (ABM) superfamily enzyme